MHVERIRAATHFPQKEKITRSPQPQNEAFSLNYDTATTREELRRDTISYLCEYRLQVPKYNYELVFGRDKNGEGKIALRDVDRGESLDNIAERAIEKKNRINAPVLREKAEKAGLESLHKQLANSQTGDMILWASPPGPKEEGYGDYGFLYTGKITKSKNGEASISMSAIRIENPTLTQYNKALTELSGDNVSHPNDIGFLANPRIIQKRIETENIDHVLKKHFSFTPDNEAQAKSETIIKHMLPMIDDFITIIRTGTDAEKKKALNALENYALAKKKETIDRTQHPDTTRPITIYEKPIRLDQIVEQYGYKPPEIRGSCGATGNSNGLTSMSGETSKSMHGSDKYGDRSYTCPACGQINIREVNKLDEKCPKCDSDKVAC